MLKLRLEEKNKKLFLLYIFDRREKYIFERFSRLLEGMVRTTCRQNWGQVAICKRIFVLCVERVEYVCGIYKKISMHIGVVYSDDIETSAIARLLKSAGIRNTNTGNLNAFVSGLM